MKVVSRACHFGRTHSLLCILLILLAICLAISIFVLLEQPDHNHDPMSNTRSHTPILVPGLSSPPHRLPASKSPLIRTTAAATTSATTGNNKKQKSGHGMPKDSGIFLPTSQVKLAKHEGGIRMVHMGQKPSTIHWCKKLGYRVDAAMAPIVALASYPGSGNTWLRYLLQQATGLMTGSVYCDHDLLNNGFPGEGVTNGSVIVVKTHECDRNKFKKAVLLIRDPYEAILAEFNRRNSATNGHLGHVGRAKPAAFRSKEWLSFVHDGPMEWERTNNFWRRAFDKNPHNLLVVHYSVLKEKTMLELGRILNFLNVDVSNETIQCVQNRTEGRFHRSHSQFKPVFDPQMRKHIETIKHRVYQQFPITR